MFEKLQVEEQFFRKFQLFMNSNMLYKIKTNDILRKKK